MGEGFVTGLSSRFKERRRLSRKHVFFPYEGGDWFALKNRENQHNSLSRMNFLRFEGLEREIQQSSAVAARRTCRPNPRVLATEGVGGRDVPAFVACPVRFALRPTRSPRCGSPPIYGCCAAELRAAFCCRFDVCGCSIFFDKLGGVGASNRVCSNLFAAHSFTRRSPPTSPRGCSHPRERPGRLFGPR